MEQRHKTLQQAGRAAIFAVFKRRYIQTRRLFVAFESFSVALVILLTTILQTYLQLSPPTYALDGPVKGLIGESRDDTAQYLSEDLKAKAFTFSVPGVSDGGNDASVHTGRIADAYEASLAKDAREGITVTEKESQIAVSLVPRFKTYEAKKVEGDHLVYLATGGVKVVYTLKYNGLKEDIILPSYRGDRLEYRFELSLPAGVEARLDGSGNIGIYSSDPTLFGEISFGSDEDRTRVEKARENGEKNHLVMTIPYPVVKDASGQEYIDKARFSLGEKQTTTSQAAADPKLPAEVQQKMKASSTKNVYELTIASQGLKDLTYPISIDPTMQVSSASDFGGLNNEGGATVDTTNNLIRRSSLTGGTLNAWTTDDTTLPAVGSEARLAAYNGYLYWAKNGSNIHYAPIAVNGDIGSFINSGVSSSSTAWAFHNGYIYNVQSGTTFQYAKIRSNGSIGPYSATTGYATFRNVFNLVAYNGYLYLNGGQTETGCPLSCSYTNFNDTQYARINADGSLGAWASAGSNFNNGGRWHHRTTVYNGYIYIVGGWQGSVGTAKGVVEYAKINDNGTISAWINTTTLIHSRIGPVVIAMDGYMYAISGWDAQQSTEYARINTDGSLSTWRLSTSVNTSGRGGAGGTHYGGRIYMGGGASDNGTIDYNDIQYTTPRSAGWTETWTTQTNQFATGRQQFGAVAYNGYLYVAGGCTGSCFNAGQSANNNVEYAPINADGSLGTWTVGPTFGGTGRAGIAMTAYNGFLYVHGGFSIDAFGTHTNYNTLFYSAVNGNTGVPAAWSSAANSPGTRAEHDIIGYNGYLYAIGGRNGTTVVDTVSAAPLDASTGATTAVFTATTSLPLDNTRSNVILAGGRFYVFGGCQVLQGGGSYVCNNPEGNIYYATPGASGTVGAWTTQTSGFVGELYDYGNVGFTGGMFYVHGGDGPAQSNYVRYAPLNSDGSVGSWTTTTSSLTLRADQETLSYGEYFYVIGGSVSRTIDRTPINNGGHGDVGTWTEDASPYPGSRRYHQVVAYNGYIYTMGGCFTNNCDATGAQTGGVEFAPINADGSIGTWASTSGFTARMSFGAVALNGYMYVSGGHQRTGAFNTLTTHTDLLYAVINSNGTLGTFNSTTSPSAAQLFTDNTSTLYVYNGTNILYAKPGANGQVTGSWSTASFAPQASTYHAGYVVSRGYLYRIGGCTNGFQCGVDTRRDVEYAPVDPTTGNTTASFKYTTPLSLKRYVTANKAFALNGYLILPPDGGPDNLGGYSYAPVLANGELGSWTKGREMPVFYASNAYTMYGGRLYVNGGVNGSNIPMGLTHYASLQSIARKGTFSRRFDFGAGIKPTKLITRGTKQTGSTVRIDYTNSVLCDATAYDNAQSIANTSYGGTNAQTLTLGTSRTLARCLFLKYTIDETGSSVFPDGSNQTTISDFDLYFTANPGQRLRGGRTFSEGADRGLDAQP